MLLAFSIYSSLPSGPSVYVFDEHDKLIDFSLDVGDSATPKNRFFTSNHEQDHQGCTPEQQWQIVTDFGLTEYVPVTSVDGRIPPFDHSRSLRTNFPGGKLDSSTAHTSVIAIRNAELLRPVWHYMLTTPVQ